MNLQLAPPVAALARQADSDAQVIELWLHDLSANTQRGYRREVGKFLASADVPLAQISVQHLQDYSDDLQASGLAASSRVLALSAIKSLLSYAYRIGYLPFNVGAAVRVKPAEDTLARRIPTVAEVRRVIKRERSPRNRALLFLLYYGGLRVSEACALCWHDLQEREEGGQVTIYGKGSKTRAVNLPSSLWGDLLALRGRASDDAPVFTSVESDRLSVSRAFRVVKAAGKRAGVPKLTPHQLRHAHASHALDNGAPIHVVMATLGHSSLRTTSRYTHVRPGESSGKYLPQV